MKALDTLCSKTTIPNTLKQKPISFENTVNILFRTVSTDLGHSWLNTPQKETTKSQHASKQIPKTSYLKHRHTNTVNPEAKFQHKIKIGNILYPEFGNELLKTGMTVTKKMDDEIYEARIWKANFAKITSASSEKKIPAKAYVRKNKACSSQKQFWYQLKSRGKG